MPQSPFGLRSKIKKVFGREKKKQEPAVGICPICNAPFPQVDLNQHAATCTNFVSVDMDNEDSFSRFAWQEGPPEAKPEPAKPKFPFVAPAAPADIPEGYESESSGEEGIIEHYTPVRDHESFEDRSLPSEQGLYPYANILQNEELKRELEEKKNEAPEYLPRAGDPGVYSYAYASQDRGIVETKNEVPEYLSVAEKPSRVPAYLANVSKETPKSIPAYLAGIVNEPQGPVAPKPRKVTPPPARIPEPQPEPVIVKKEEKQETL